MNSSIPIRTLKPLLITALILNVLILIYLSVIFLFHRSAAQQLPNSDKIELIEKALRGGPAEEGRNNAIELLTKATTSLSATVSLVRRGYYCTAAVLLANILFSGVCLYRLTGNRQDQS
jgi:hypothetical protein